MSEIDPDRLAQLVANHQPGILIELVETVGSAPRDGGAKMIVLADELLGTIGGGRAEWIAVERAREILGGAEYITREDITLGPAIDQCCGGTLTVEFTALSSQLLTKLRDELSTQPTTIVNIFGAGHTGQALAKALEPLPISVSLIDTRPVIGSEKIGSEVVLTALPETIVRDAEPACVFVVATHDHSLDFLITAEALARRDAKYVGMIGSKTKRAAFASWLGKNGYDPKLFENLTCPIGGKDVADKRPAVIAAMTAAQIMIAIN